MKITEIVVEEKQKGVDGKACWDGYKRMGTKKKGGKTVDNCVKMEEAAPHPQELEMDAKVRSMQIQNRADAVMKRNAQQPKTLGQKIKKDLVDPIGKLIRGDIKGSLSEDEKKTMSRAAKGNEKYGKDGMKELAKAGREGASEEELDKIRDKHDRYDESDELARLLVLGGMPLYEDLDPDAQFDIVEDMVMELAEAHGVDAEQIWEDFESVDDVELYETAAWRRSEGKSKKGGLNAKGVASYRREHPGSKLQMAVTTKPSKLKKGSKAAKRRKSFCARMSGVKGPMKKPNGKPTRKALALRKWNC